MAPLHYGAGAPLCRISNMQNNARLTFHLESMLISVSMGSNLPRLKRYGTSCFDSALAQSIHQKASRLNSSFCFVTDLSTDLDPLLTHHNYLNIDE